VVEPRMRERLARRLFDELLFGGCGGWDEASEAVRAAYLSKVDAILDELLSPSEEMVEAGANGIDDGLPQEARAVWAAMISAARES
jgi:hypothetical protein